MQDGTGLSLGALLSATDLRELGHGVVYANLPVACPWFLAHWAWLLLTDVR